METSFTFDNAASFKAEFKELSNLSVEFKELNNLCDGGSVSTDVSLGLKNATVGDIIKVKTVDENGVPTEWETADVANEEDAIETLAECAIVVPAYQDGVFYTDVNGAIYTL